MAGTPGLGQPVCMKPAHRAAPARLRNETVAPALFDRTDGTTSELVIGASEFAEYEQELDRLRAVRARDLPDRFRRAREYVGADAAEEIAHIQEDHAVIGARIARLEDLLRTAIAAPGGSSSRRRDARMHRRGRVR